MIVKIKDILGTPIQLDTKAKPGIVKPIVNQKVGQRMLDESSSNQERADYWGQKPNEVQFLGFSLALLYPVHGSKSSGTVMALLKIVGFYSYFKRSWPRTILIN